MFEADDIFRSEPSVASSLPFSQAHTLFLGKDQLLPESFVVLRVPLFYRLFFSNLIIHYQPTYFCISYRILRDVREERHRKKEKKETVCASRRQFGVSNVPPVDSRHVRPVDS